jgi:uncharacterized protein with beta-barrel porin domain
MSRFRGKRRSLCAALSAVLDGGRSTREHLPGASGLCLAASLLALGAASPAEANTIGFSPITYEADEGDGTVNVTLSLSTIPDSYGGLCTGQANLVAVSRSATLGTDFSLGSSSVSFQYDQTTGGDTTLQVPVTLIDDLLAEVTEEFELRLADVSVDGANCTTGSLSITSPTARVSIRDNDVAADLLVDPSLVAATGVPGTEISRTLTVMGGVAPYRITTENADAVVTPALLSEPGSFRYELVLSSATDGIIDVIRVTDARGRTVTATVTQDPLSGLPGLTGSQQEIARTLETLCGNLTELSGSTSLSAAQQDLLEQCRSLLDASQSDPQAAVEGIVAITPDQSNAPTTLQSSLTNAQDTNLQRRLQGLRSGVSGLSFTGLTMNFNGRTLPTRLLTGFLENTAFGQGASADEPSEFGRLGFFVAGNIDFGDRDGSSNEAGFEFDTAGITAGADYRITDQAVFGAALGFANTDLDYDGGRGDLQVDAWSASLYGNYYLTETVYLDGTISYGWDNYDQTRSIVYSLLEAPRNASADFDGTGYTLSLGGGHEDYIGPVSYGLYGRVRYHSAEIDGYRESGASGLELDIEGWDVNSLKTTLGGRIARVFNTSYGVLIPQLRLEWEHEFEDAGDTLDGTFVHDPIGTRFRLPTETLDSDYFRLGLSVSAQFTHGRSAYFNYETLAGQRDVEEHSFTLGARLEF